MVKLTRSAYSVLQEIVGLEQARFGKTTFPTVRLTRMGVPNIFMMSCSE